MEKASQAKLNPGPRLLLGCKAAADGRARTFGTQHAGGRGGSPQNHRVHCFESMVQGIGLRDVQNHMAVYGLLAGC